MRFAAFVATLLMFAACSASTGGPAPNSTPAAAGDSPAVATAAFDASGADDALEWSIFVPEAAMAIPRLGPGLVAEAQAAVADYRAQAEESRANPATPFQTWLLDLEWSTAFQNAAVLSLEGRRTEFSGGAHPVTGYDSLLWDQATLRRLTLADLFANRRDRGPALSAVSDAALEAYRVEAARKSATGEADEYWDVNAREVLQPTAGSFENFVLVASDATGRAAGVELLYGPYVLGPYVEGDYRLFISADVLVPHLASRFRDLFGGAPAAPADS